MVSEVGEFGGATSGGAGVAAERLGGLAARLAGFSRFERLAWSAWGLCILAISVIVAFKPQRDITHVYRDASFHWWASLPLYSDGIHGFLYLPSSALLFSPIAYFPWGAGGMVWRWLSFVLITWAVWRLTRLALPERFWGSVIGLVLLAAIPASTVNLVRAQSEVIMAALMIHAAVDLGRQRWSWAALSLCLAVALKPLALVMLLLAAAVMPPLRLRAALGLALVLLLPFLHPDPGYVADQYAAMVHKLLVAVEPGSGRWNELGALLAQLHLRPSESVMTGVRLIAGGGALALAWLALRRHGPVQGAVYLLALAVCYQLLFNPRTEEGSYFNLAILAGLFAGLAWYVDRRPWVARALIALCLGLGTHMYGDWIYRPTDLWLKPLLALVFAAFLVHRALTDHAVASARRAGADSLACPA